MSNFTSSYVTITAGDGGTFQAYFAAPIGEKKGPGVVLLQEVFGINANMRSVANHYAAEGYLACVPDLFWRMEPGLDIDYADIDKARQYGMKLDLDLAIKDILVTAKYLESLPELQGKVGVLGFCLGGLLAFLTAARAKGAIAGAVGYYGVRLDHYLKEADTLSCPLLLHFGELDSLTPASLITSVKEAVKDKSTVLVYTYPDGGHGFASPLRPAHYHQASAELALKRTCTFLTEYLQI